MSALRATLFSTLALAAPSLCGCGGVFDIAYLASHKTTEETTQERSPTGQVHRALEFEGSAGSAGVLQIQCTDSDRMVERSSSIRKTYRYIGGYTSTPYIATAVISGVTAGAVAGVIAMVCENDAKSTDAEKTACLQNMLAATPFAVDSMYSTIRAATAKEPKLVEKSVGTPTFVFSERPVRSTPIACDTSKIYLKDQSGPPPPNPDDLLNGRDDKAPLPLAGALELPVTPDGKIPLRMLPEAVHRWADNRDLVLWLVDPEGRAHRLRVERCAALTPVADMLPPDARMRLVQSCAPPSPPPQR